MFPRIGVHKVWEGVKESVECFKCTDNKFWSNQKEIYICVCVSMYRKKIKKVFWSGCEWKANEISIKKCFQLLWWLGLLLACSCVHNILFYIRYCCQIYSYLPLKKKTYISKLLISSSLFIPDWKFQLG